MEWKMVWNGRRILVWNMEDAQNEMEWKVIFHTKYKYNIRYIKTYNKLQKTTKLE